MTRQRIFVFSRPEERSLDACSASLLVLLRGLRELSPGLSFREGVRGEALDSRRACTEALARGEHIGNLGARGTLRAFDLKLVAQRTASMVARLRVVMGLGLDLTPLWRGNRVELTMQLTGVPDAELATDTLIALATSTDADWGFVGGDAVPYLPPTGPGTPAVGWLTFLSSRHILPPSLPDPARIVKLGVSGSLVSAQPTAVREDRSEDLANVQAVRDALGPLVLQSPPLPGARAAPAQPPVRPPP